jgi:hypothetical protein
LKCLNYGTILKRFYLFPDRVFSASGKPSFDLANNVLS